ncbi:MAG: carbohydrate ABC transporter permease [Epulopiscium sp.]|nr:carbohydrate ABC transporter permease [Candidatus Epulonipiscium sp.]
MEENRTVPLNTRILTRIQFKNRFTFRKHFGLGQIGAYILLIFWTFTTIYPLIWILINSFKTTNEIVKNSFNLPSSFNMTNYMNAFQKMGIGRSYLNSLIISGSTVLLVVLFGGMAAFIMARFDFKLKKFIYTLFLGSLMFPAFATIVPVFTMLRKAQLINKHIGLILPQTAGNLAFAIIILTGFMMSIPIELEEAAVVEGAAPWQVYVRIVVPISKPSFATVSIFTFLWSYNDLFMPLIILRNKDVQPINVLLSHISSQYGTDYGLMAAAVAIIIVPVLIVYFSAQKYIIKGLTAGAIKG